VILESLTARLESRLRKWLWATRSLEFGIGGTVVLAAGPGAHADQLPSRMPQSRTAEQNPASILSIVHQRPGLVSPTPPARPWAEFPALPPLLASQQRADCGVARPTSALWYQEPTNGMR